MNQSLASLVLRGAVIRFIDVRPDTLNLDERLLETRPLKIPAGETSPQVFVASQARDGEPRGRHFGHGRLAAAVE